MTTTDTIRQGSKVELIFTLTLSDGTLVEESGEKPDTITIGEGNIVSGMEELLLGLTAGENVNEPITAEQNLFGPYDDDNIQIIPLSEFDESSMPEPGQIIEFSLPSGQAAPGRINQVDENVAIVDFNHPLADRDLIFKAEILFVENG